MQTLSSNKGLMGTLVVSAVVTIGLACGQPSELYAYLELAPLPTEEARSELMSLMFIDAFLCKLFEKVASKLFGF